MKLRPLPALAAALVAALNLSATAQVEIPTLVNYQGYLTNDSGVPLGSPSATNYDIQFRLYDASTGEGVLWGEQQTVTVLDGRFSILLGNGIDISQSVPHGDLADLFSPGDDPVEQVFIGITVNNEGQTGEPELVPRQQLVANPFSLRAKIADSVYDNAVTGSTIADGSVTGTDIADSSILTSHISNGTVRPEDTNFALGTNSLRLFTPAGGPGGGSINITPIPPEVGLHPFLQLVPNSTGLFPARNAIMGTRLWTGTTSIPQPFPLPPITFPTFNSSFYMKNSSAATGSAFLGDNGTWSASSDERLKTDIEPASNLLEKALALEPVHYRFKTSPEGSTPDLGFTAQDVGEQFPELVTTGDSWSLNYSGLSTVAIGAIQEQHAVIEQQGAEIDSLKKENDELKLRLERLENAILAK